MILYKNSSYNNRIGQELLIMAVRDYCDKKGLRLSNAPEAFAIDKGEHGKPYFAQLKELHFSISHSGTLWLCGIQANPLGLDIEALDKHHDKRLDQYAVKDRYMKIAARFFTDGERRYADNHGIEGFLSIWVRKEAYVKLKGTGLTEDFRSFSVVSKGRLADRVGMAALRPLDAGADCIGAYCSELPSELEEIIDLEAKNDR